MLDKFNEFYFGNNKNVKKKGRYYLFSYNNGYGTVKFAYLLKPLYSYVVDRFSIEDFKRERRFSKVSISGVDALSLAPAYFGLHELLSSQKVDLQSDGALYLEGVMNYFEFQALKKNIEKFILDEQLAEEFLIFD
jgi:hypothetical protein